ncbi:MAG TPA: T9SS type A sorting domain-containing protein [Chitinophagales bacterium]|nr:T9SS type A sorting domain-containing protein [Chitinophagales bacterium]
MKKFLSATFALLFTIPAFSVTVYITTNNAFCTYSNGSMYATPSGGSVPYSVIWSNGATTWGVTGLAAATTLTATVTDGLGATASATATIQGQPHLNELGISFAGSEPCEGMCNGVGGTSLVDLGGVPPYWGTYDGEPMYPEVYNPGLRISNVCWNATGNLYIEDANGCNVSYVFPPLYYTPIPVIDDVVVTNACYGNNGTATVISNAWYYYIFHYINSNGEVVDSTSGSQVGNLAPGTYTVQVTSFTSHYEYFYGLITEYCSSDTQQFTIAGCSKPTNPTTTNITSAKAKLNWNTNSNCAVGYRIHYKQTGNTWKTANVSSNIGYKTIKNLLPNTSYTWKVRTKCNIDPVVFSPWSPAVSFNTAMKLAPIEEAEEATLNIFPNPTSGNVRMEMDNSTAIHAIMIQNVVGQVLFYENFSEERNTPIELDLSILPAGSYLLTVITNEGKKVKLFIKK